ncbi:DUF805 domain-containing protein [Lacticaseibacillus hegangensis]|uniref:DUF805 domain-containing protein n=1 Tax=Lacticaseibacillus hegangensis TaxID=2486010 RepID=A0ABW4CTY4_9LACO|nr:DUF805 domain-containing protein [Lacticaseibacillus hegangensis]
MAVKSNKAEQIAADNRYYRATGVSTLKALFSNYLNFRGRSSRAEYWWVYLFGLSFALIAAIGLPVALAALLGLQGLTIKQWLFSLGGWLVLLLVLFVITFTLIMIPLVTLVLRRYRDAGLPWWIILVQAALYLATLFLKPDSTLRNLLTWVGATSIPILMLLPSKALPATTGMDDEAGSIDSTDSSKLDG